jgi:hypothetical protein
MRFPRRRGDRLAERFHSDDCNASVDFRLFCTMQHVLGYQGRGSETCELLDVLARFRALTNQPIRII